MAFDIVGAVRAGRVAALLAGAWIAVAGSPAAAVTAQDILSGFNNIVLGDLTANAETEGPVWVGGTYSGGATVNADGLPDVDLGNGQSATFVVGGNVAGNANLQSGNALVGGSITGSILNNGAGTVSQNVAGLPLAEVESLVLGLSGDLALLADTGGTASLADQNQLAFTSIAGGDGIAVFNVSGSWLASGTFQGITADPGVTTVINVAGVNLSIGVNANQTLAGVIFNFYEAETLAIGTAFNYSILAPLADVTLQGGGINGTVISGNLVQGSEIRPGTFNGTLPPPPSPPPPPSSDVPLPAAGWSLLAGLAALGAVRRRRRRA